MAKTKEWTKKYNPFNNQNQQNQNIRLCEMGRTVAGRTQDERRTDRGGKRPSNRVCQKPQNKQGKTYKKNH